MSLRDLHRRLDTLEVSEPVERVDMPSDIEGILALCADMMARGQMVHDRLTDKGINDFTTLLCLLTQFHHREQGGPDAVALGKAKRDCNIAPRA